MFRRFSFTALTLIVFIFALYHEGLVLDKNVVSRETSTASANGVTAGVSQDGMVALTILPNPPQAFVGEKVPNHSRTLRAYVSKNLLGYESIYLESAQPEEYFLISGSFFLSVEMVGVRWFNDSTLEFFAKLPDGETVKILFDVRTHSALLEPMMVPSESIPVEKIQIDD